MQHYGHGREHSRKRKHGDELQTALEAHIKEHLRMGSLRTQDKKLMGWTLGELALFGYVFAMEQLGKGVPAESALRTINFYDAASYIAAERGILSQTPEDVLRRVSASMALRFWESQLDEAIESFILRNPIAPVSVAAPLQQPRHPRQPAPRKAAPAAAGTATAEANAEGHAAPGPGRRAVRDSGTQTWRPAKDLQHATRRASAGQQDEPWPGSRQAQPHAAAGGNGNNAAAAAAAAGPSMPPVRAQHSQPQPQPQHHPPVPGAGWWEPGPRALARPSPEDMEVEVEVKEEPDAQPTQASTVPLYDRQTLRKQLLLPGGRPRPPLPPSSTDTAAVGSHPGSHHPCPGIACQTTPTSKRVAGAPAAAAGAAATTAAAAEAGAGASHVAPAAWYGAQGPAPPPPPRAPPMAPPFPPYNSRGEQFPQPPPQRNGAHPHPLEGAGEPRPPWPLPSRQDHHHHLQRQKQPKASRRDVGTGLFDLAGPDASSMQPHHPQQPHHQHHPGQRQQQEQHRQQHQHQEQPPPLRPQHQQYRQGPGSGPLCTAGAVYGTCHQPSRPAKPPCPTSDSCGGVAGAAGAACGLPRPHPLRANGPAAEGGAAAAIKQRSQPLAAFNGRPLEGSGGGGDEGCGGSGWRRVPQGPAGLEPAPSSPSDNPTSSGSGTAIGTTSGTGITGSSGATTSSSEGGGGGSGSDGGRFAAAAVSGAAATSTGTRGVTAATAAGTTATAAATAATATVMRTAAGRNMPSGPRSWGGGAATAAIGANAAAGAAAGAAAAGAASVHGSWQLSGGAGPGPGPGPGSGAGADAAVGHHGLSQEFQRRARAGSLERKLRKHLHKMGNSMIKQYCRKEGLPWTLLDLACYGTALRKLVSGAPLDFRSAALFLARVKGWRSGEHVQQSPGRGGTRVYGPYEAPPAALVEKVAVAMTVAATKYDLAGFIQRQGGNRPRQQPAVAQPAAAAAAAAAAALVPHGAGAGSAAGGAGQQQRGARGGGCEPRMGAGLESRLRAHLRRLGNSKLRRRNVRDGVGWSLLELVALDRDVRLQQSCDSLQALEVARRLASAKLPRGQELPLATLEAISESMRAAYDKYQLGRFVAAEVQKRLKRRRREPAGGGAGGGQGSAFGED